MRGNEASWRRVSFTLIWVVMLKTTREVSVEEGDERMESMRIEYSVEFLPFDTM